MWFTASVWVSAVRLTGAASPGWAKIQTSTRVAFWEKRANCTPPETGVAPSGVAARTEAEAKRPASRRTRANGTARRDGVRRLMADLLGRGGGRGTVGPEALEANIQRQSEG